MAKLLPFGFTEFYHSPIALPTLLVQGDGQEDSIRQEVKPGPQTL